MTSRSMSRSCAAGTRITPRPIRAAKARRRAATLAVSTGRPIPGSSGTGVHAPIGAPAAAGRACAAATVATAAQTTTMQQADRMGSEATARPCARQLDAASAADANYAMPSTSAAAAADSERLAARVAELERERTHLLAVIEILKEVSTSLHFIDILQAIARKLGEAFGLDRCSIFLAERGGRSVRLVASYEDPTIRNYVVDLERYPELKRAMQSGETVFIPDAATDPSLKHVKGELINRRVKSITVVPITWRGVSIGAIFLRTFRDGPPSPTMTSGSCRWSRRSPPRRCATPTATSAWRSASRRPARRCAAWGSSAWPCSPSCGACWAPSASARARGRKGCCRAPARRSSTG